MVLNENMIQAHLPMVNGKGSGILRRHLFEPRWVANWICKVQFGGRNFARGRAGFGAARLLNWTSPVVRKYPCALPCLWGPEGTAVLPNMKADWKR